MHSIESSAELPSLREQLVRESSAMVRHLVTNGFRVPPSVIQSADQFETALADRKPIDMTALASTHERLARLVTPAKPGTLYLLDFSFHQNGREPSSLGPIKVVRDLVKVAMVCVGLFIILSVVSLVEAHPDIRLFEARGSNNHTLLVIKVILERVFWLAAAGIGAAFAMLFSLNDQIVNSTFDPDETPSYWVKFFLGLVAGFILVALVPLDTGSAREGAVTGAQALGPPTIALLGGFSASAVYRILTRMVEALESVFMGGPKEQAAAAEKAASSRAAEESAQGRMAVAGQLVEVQQQLAAGMSSEEAAQQIRQVVAALVPASSEFSRPADPAGPPARVPALAVVAAPADPPAAPSSGTPAEATGTPADASTSTAPQPAAGAAG